jgi:NhaP-type Na+/H+ or K+/H+ antiporter
MASIELLAVILAIVLIAGVSRRIRNTVVTLPMLYVLFGLLVGWLLQGRVVLSPEDSLLEFVAALTLIYLLATDASRITMHSLLRSHTLSLRLLLIGLPLTAVLGTVAGRALTSALTFWEAAVLAVCLAPTDTSPAERAVNNPRVPVRIRQALDIEGGLNDGITTPILVLAGLMAATEGLGGRSLLWFGVREIILGVLTGVGIGYLGAQYIRWGKKSGWMSSRFQKIGWLALVLLTYVLAERLGGNGFVAAFCFGLTSGNLFGRQEEEPLYRFADVENSLLMLITYVLFGMVVLVPALERINPVVLLYAALSLTVVRMLAVAISLIGTRLRPLTVLYMGWFGPRGIATILYVLIVIDVEAIAAGQLIYDVAVITVFISVLLHGLSAAPLSEWYGKWVAKLAAQGAAGVEMAPVPEAQTRTVTARDETARDEVAGG